MRGQTLNALSGRNCRSLGPVFTGITLVLVLASMTVLQGAQPSLVWQRVGDLPNPDGLKGMYGGMHGGHAILAGGSNFPGNRQGGGPKQFHDVIFVGDVSGVERRWRVSKGKLPAPAAEGAAVTTSFGVVCLGGRNAVGLLKDVFLLAWDPAAADVTYRQLPSLPEALAGAAAAVIGDAIYLAGGEGKRGAVARFWRLDVSAALSQPDVTTWQELPPWVETDPPSRVAGIRGRHGAMMVAVFNQGRPGLLLMGGLGGTPRSQADYLTEVLYFDLSGRNWSRRSPMPRGAMLGSGLALGTDDHVLVLGGSDGHDFERIKELGEHYLIPSDVLAYDVNRDVWESWGTMPLGLVGASVIELGGAWLVAGGEYSPGKRTAQVHELKVAP